ncbi:MAG TPA: alpha/beta hydrolase [Candidatus Saccharimonadales bacterium]|nr:alpha/beta hydrolase [Candidatus Saccharimonadales bacterium]
MAEHKTENLAPSALYDDWLYGYAQDTSYVAEYAMGGVTPRPLELARQAQEIHYAPSTNQSDETIPYVRVGDAAGNRPVLYVPGFTAGIMAKLPVAVGMAKRKGVEVILPGQNRKEILKDGLSGKEDATYSQAVNMLDVLGDAGLGNRTVDVMTHSYGSLIFEKMVQIADRRGLRCFQDSHVVMTAPAGLNNRENPFALGLRFAKGFRSEGPMHKDILKDGFDALGDEMFRAGQANVRANVPRALREAWELARRRLDIAALRRSGIGSLAILSFAQDDLFPARIAERTMAQAFADQPGIENLAPIVWATPVSLQGKPGEPIRGGRDAGHNDDQFNPARVAGAVYQLMHPLKTRYRIGFADPNN